MTLDRPAIVRTELSQLDPRAGLDVAPLPDAEARLAALSARVREDLAVLDYPLMSWVTPRTGPAGEHVHDVLVVGAGQGGLATAFALRREKVDNVLVIDRAKPGREGPWVTYARMLTFRSPKHVTGPDLGVPSLTPRAYYVARFGETAWQALGKYPRQTWQDYLDWYRATLELPVANHTEVARIEPVEGGLFRVVLRPTGPGGLSGSAWARKVVLATGIEGNGDWRLPDLDLSAVPSSRYAHTNWTFDVAALRGKRVALLGAGASAFDTAGALLEAGAAHVTQYVRRSNIPNVNPARWMEKAGFLRHFADMDDSTRWRWMRILFLRSGPPTQDGINRCAAFSNYRLRKGTTWRSASMDGDTIVLRANDGSTERVDFLVLGTGYVIDVRRRPELSGFAEHIALWGDRFAPPLGEENAVVAAFPYLNPDLSFQERTPGSAPYLSDIHNFTYSATASVGYSGASLTGMKYGLQRMVAGITRALWLQDQAAHLAAMQAYDEVDLDVTPLDPHAGERIVHAMSSAAE